VRSGHSFLFKGGCVTASPKNGLIRGSGEVLVNGKLVSAEQLSSGDSLLVSNASTLSTSSDGSAVFLVRKDGRMKPFRFSWRK